MTTTLVVPGLHGSGPTHWQSWFEAITPQARRVHQADWSRPALDIWAEEVIDAIDAAAGDVVLVAHSFGCLASVAASVHRRDRIAATLLVAPADPAKFGVEALLPVAALGFDSIVVGSTNDPWVSLNTAQTWAARWGSRFVDVGAKGHINVDSGFGPWPEGYALYESLLGGVAVGSTHVQPPPGAAPPRPIAGRPASRLTRKAGAFDILPSPGCRPDAHLGGDTALPPAPFQ
ncbi:alpha/beta hydrolase [Azoarcus sp. DD4]|uniref:RBBP9/YdeN family alpha/beta hydrolase n=1 Tax=Azoarcus sp. DD4 TaxID=2027405 RepID=UPI001127BD79|nr:alpha/beta hydrolase [Azoarcus sp. DD4]QDF97751.1 alpha/beta hydrolase [Azoarcus sp. DD4]